MGSHDNWLDIPHQERQALAFVVRDGTITADVFRRPAQTGAAGLTSETKQPEYLRTTSVRIDSHSSSRGADGLRPIVTRLIALTNDTDVRLDDLWRLLDVSGRLRWYRVAEVSRRRTASSVTLEETKR